MNARIKIDAGEKYALIAFQSTPSKQLTAGNIAPNVWVSTKSLIRFDEHWSDWLGSIRAEQLSSANFFIVSKMGSRAPTIIDQENRQLSRAVTNFYLAILLSGRIPYYDKPLLLTGGKTVDDFSIKEYTEIDQPISFLAIDGDEIDDPLLLTATQLLPTLTELWDGTNRYKRLRRIFNIYIDARNRADILERLHQFCRCIEGFIIPSAGATTKMFRSRTELFIGPHSHNLMGDIYEMRNAIEHLNDHLNLTSKSREDRALIYKWAYIVEAIARDCLNRVLLNWNLRKKFETDDSLKDFWRLPRDVQQRLWGPTISPSKAVDSFDIRSISNSELGISSQP